MSNINNIFSNAVNIMSGPKCIKKTNRIGKGASGQVYNTTCSNKKIGNKCNFSTEECHNGVIKIIPHSSSIAEREMTILKILANPGNPCVLKLYDSRKKKSDNFYLYLNKAGNSDLFEIINIMYMNQFDLKKYVKEVTKINTKIKTYEKNKAIFNQINTKNSIFSNSNKNSLEHEIIKLKKEQDRLQKEIRNINLNKKIQFTPKEINKIMKDVIDGMCYIYDKGYIQNDIKPENLLVKEDILFSNSNKPTTTIIDFGIAGKIGEDTNSNLFYGTAEYMSPEKAFSYLNFDANKSTKYKLNIADDIWALGCVYYFILYISPPWSIFDMTNDEKMNYMGMMQPLYISLANMAEVPSNSNIQLGNRLKNRGSERKFKLMPENFGSEILDKHFKTFFFGSVKERTIETLKNLRDHLNAGKSIFEWVPPTVA